MIEARPDVLAHNLDTVPRLYAKVKPKSSYEHSLNLLRHVKQTAPHIKTKAGLMLGLGEEVGEIDQAMDDVRSARVDILTIGQYLRPSLKHLPLLKHYHPDEFRGTEAYWRREGDSPRRVRPARSQFLPCRRTSGRTSGTFGCQHLPHSVVSFAPKLIGAIKRPIFGDQQHDAFSPPLTQNILPLKHNQPSQ